MQTATIKTTSEPQIRERGLCEYRPVWHEMRDYTRNRNAASPDQIWYLQHHPVYTLGLNGKQEHILSHNNIPVVEVDRGGQITYHGPGQLVAYLLVDIKRKHIGIRTMVEAMEQSVIDYLVTLGISGERKTGAPGIYVNGAKIAALGLRVKKGCTYHGLSLNIDMDLTPFSDINPCGYQGLPVTQIKDELSQSGHASCPDMQIIQDHLHTFICRNLRYESSSI